MLISIWSCGENRHQYEYYDTESLANRDFLSQNNHPHGYEGGQCLNCHILSNIDHENIFARQEVNQKGEESCFTCHGDNGVME